MTSSLPQLTATISRRALVENARHIAERVAPSQLAIVVKDDAYAHGLAPVVSTLTAAGFHHFGALDMATARRVREIDAEAMIFTWVFGADDDLREAVDAELDLGVSYPEILERVSAAARAAERTARVHLKIDTGLHRAGVTADEWPSFVNRAAELEKHGALEVVGMWTHISEASFETDSESIARFTDAVDIARRAGLSPQIRHLAASAASYEREDARFDMVRVGAFVYGIAPGDGVGPEHLGLTPALTLSTRVTAVHEHDGRRLAAIPVGQVHGLYAEAAGAVSVSVRGRACMIDSVEAGLAWLNVSAVDAVVGDNAYLFGDGSHGEATLQVWADAMNSIGEELVIRLARRSEHRYVS